EMVKLLQHPNQKMLAGAMPPLNLNEQSMSDLVIYIRSLSTPPTAIATAASPAERGVASAAPVSAPVTTAPPLPANTLETEGKAIFEAYNCGSCHGAKGAGGTSAATALAGPGGSLPPEVLTKMLRHPTNPMQQGGMPPISVTDSELKSLVAYIGYISRSSNKQ
ncbi:MAG TPA: cytochrome c, partial [Candidatus Acidoferrum sp.]|nr:cytochrome c [Candidatus Acidoferrum sp.]